MEKHLFSTIYKNGQKQKHEKSNPPPTRVYLAKSFAFIFLHLLTLRVDRLSKMNLTELVRLGIRAEIENFIADAFECGHEVLGLKNGITKSCKSKVARFRIHHDRIKAAVFSIENGISRIDPKLLAELGLMLDDCLHFINEFRKTCDYVLNLAALANRPVDRELKRNFAFAVIEFQNANNTSKFPPHLVICKAIGLSPLRFSERRYRDWKSQMLNHTLHYFRQPKKVKSAAISTGKDAQ